MISPSTAALIAAAAALVTLSLMPAARALEPLRVVAEQGWIG